MREQKGTNLLIFPNDYTVIDIETTGLSPEYDEIIEVCALKYRSKKMIDKYTTLVKPEYPVDEYITSLTGITNDMLSSAPSLKDIIHTLYNFIGNDIIVGHSVNFDINFIYDACNQYLSEPLTNDFVDTLRLARLLHNEEHNRLKDLCIKYNLSYDNAHRAEFDCLVTNEILSIFNNEFIENYGENETISNIFRRYENGKLIPIKAADISTDKTEFDIDNPIYGKTVVFTGALEKMVRKDAMQMVADYGGINGDNVTKNTNYLVLGNNDYHNSIKNGKSSKQKKAENYKLKGYDIEIIPENVFYDMVDIPSSEPVPTYNNDNIYKQSLSLSDREISVIDVVKSYLSTSPDFSAFGVDVRSDNYITLLCGNNDFMRFKYSHRVFWISLRLPYDVAKANIDNPLFAAQQNKKQAHWKAALTSFEEIEKLKDFIILSFIND